MDNKLESLSYQWSRIDGQGLVRVVPVDGFKTGFILMAGIGELAESKAYYPELNLTSDKVTITIDDSDESAAFELAEGIDKLLPSDDPHES
ncbi:MAG TPA: 4a-hydroxytetrahydrobiopterin dehydratase [Candidatus Nitrosotenuis sp.]|nr:4a-hydroxytetrahydrobiopterin dehydratase [Candidatus Nitrosotenuis sp.]